MVVFFLGSERHRHPLRHPPRKATFRPEEVPILNPPSSINLLYPQDSQFAYCVLYSLHNNMMYLYRYMNYM